jgi:hypothetical protein
MCLHEDVTRKDILSRYPPIVRLSGSVLILWVGSIFYVLIPGPDFIQWFCILILLTRFGHELYVPNPHSDLDIINTCNLKC